MLSRRGFMLSTAALAGALRAMPSTPACVLTTEQEEGPYYIDYQHLRRDITEGKPGVPLRLKIALMHAKRCTPLPDAALDIWHCDALGVYSGFTANHPGGPPPAISGLWMPPAFCVVFKQPIAMAWPSSQPSTLAGTRVEPYTFI